MIFLLFNSYLSCEFLLQESDCKYYRVNVYYCIQKKWYLTLYKKIKSLLCIQLITGLRGLAWHDNTHARTHTNNYGPCPCSEHTLPAIAAQDVYLTGSLSSAERNTQHMQWRSQAGWEWKRGEVKFFHFVKTFPSHHLIISLYKSN